MTSISFLGITITTQKLKLETQMIKKVVKLMKLPATVRQKKQLLGFLLFLFIFTKRSIKHNSVVQIITKNR